MNILYLDCINSGISGDLFLAALLDLIPNYHEILEELSELTKYLKGVSKLKLALMDSEINDIKVKQLKITIKEDKDHRSAITLKDSLNKFIKNKDFLNQAGKVYAEKVLDTLIKAESDVHGELEEKIHLHELSSVDTLIDILGVSKALETLGVFSDKVKVYCSKLPLGGGTVKSAHGRIAIPAPATLKILEKSDLIISPGPIEDEISTPTGVALLHHLHPEISSISFNIKKVGQSVGTKKFDNFLNLFRIYYGEINETEKGVVLENSEYLKYKEKVGVIETNIDDVSGEIIGDFFDIMATEDILDIQLLQGITKKNRPSYIIRILCKPEGKISLIEKIFHNLSTLGVRYYDINRICVDREVMTLKMDIQGKNFPVEYKISYLNLHNEKKIINIKPEYEDLRKIRSETGHSIKELQNLFYKKIYDGK